MKKAWILGIISVTLVSCGDEVVYVKNKVIMEKYKKAVDVNAESNRIFSGYGMKKDSLTRAFQQKVAEYQKNIESYSPAKRKSEEDKLIQEKQGLENFFQGQEQQLQRLAQAKSDTLIKDLKSQILKFAEDKGYKFVFGDNDMNYILYASESRDVTEDLIETLNNEYDETKKK